MVGIKDFEMPKNCGDCYLTSIKSVSNPWDMICSCNLNDIDINEQERAEHCPLVEIKENKDDYEEQIKINNKLVKDNKQLKAHITMMQVDYKASLKADMVAMLIELKNKLIDKSWNIDMYDDDLDFECCYLTDIDEVIQQKIDKLKENEDGANTD